MKLGIEVNHGFTNNSESLYGMLNRAKKIGAKGVQFKNPTYISKTLDHYELREAKAIADELDMYIATGLGRINPYNTSEVPEMWQLGGGSYKKACEMLIEAGAILGSHHLASVTGGWRGDMPEPYPIDRFREDVIWEDQLKATKKFIKLLAPTLRDYGSTIAIETHEEITSFEILRIIEELDSDIVSVTLDTGNVIARGEDPIASTKRLAPYIHQVHVKDCLLLRTDKGLVRNIRPAGDGVIDFKQIAEIIYSSCPHALFHIEDHMGEMFINYKDPVWLSKHKDLKQEEIKVLEAMSEQSYAKIESGAIVPPETYEKIPFENMCQERIEKALKYLAPIVNRDY